MVEVDRLYAQKLLTERGVGTSSLVCKFFGHSMVHKTLSITSTSRCTRCSFTIEGLEIPKAPKQVVGGTKEDSRPKDSGLSTACYDIPPNAKTLDDLIEHKKMCFAVATIFKVCYAFEERSSRNSAASKAREANKLVYYAARLKKLYSKDT